MQPVCRHWRNVKRLTHATHLRKAPILSALRVVDCVEKHAFRKDLLPTTDDMLLTFISGLPRQVASPQKLSQRYQGLTQASRDAAPPPPPAMVVRYHTLLWNQRGHRLEEGTLEAIL
jgi:hypothetical protein